MLQLYPIITAYAYLQLRGLLIRCPGQLLDWVYIINVQNKFYKNSLFPRVIEAIDGIPVKILILGGNDR